MEFETTTTGKYESGKLQSEISPVDIAQPILIAVTEKKDNNWQQYITDALGKPITNTVHLTNGIEQILEQEKIENAHGILALLAKRKAKDYYLQ